MKMTDAQQVTNACTVGSGVVWAALVRFSANNAHRLRSHAQFLLSWRKKKVGTKEHRIEVDYGNLSTAVGENSFSTKKQTTGMRPSTAAPAS